MQIRRSATAIAAVIFGSSTCFAGVDFCKEFSSLARTSASLSDATYMLNLLSERALQIAEQILSEQRLIPVEAVGALQQFARTYSELDSQRNSPVLMDEYSQSFIEALIANH